MLLTADGHDDVTDFNIKPLHVLIFVTFYIKIKIIIPTAKAVRLSSILEVQINK